MIWGVETSRFRRQTLQLINLARFFEILPIVHVGFGLAVVTELQRQRPQDMGQTLAVRARHPTSRPFLQNCPESALMSRLSRRVVDSEDLVGLDHSAGWSH